MLSGVYAGIISSLMTWFPGNSHESEVVPDEEVADLLRQAELKLRQVRSPEILLGMSEEIYELRIHTTSIA